MAAELGLAMGVVYVIPTSAIQLGPADKGNMATMCVIAITECSFCAQHARRHRGMRRVYKNNHLLQHLYIFHPLTQ